MRFVDRVLSALAAILFASLLVECWHDVSMAWDVWYYHLPFAGRISGLITSSSYTFGRLNQARFEGFPLLGEAIQGLLWRITGRIECASFLSLGGLASLVWFLRRAFAVPPHLALLALLAIPLVQIHGSGAYVDLPANSAVTMLALIGYRQFVLRKPPSRRTLGLSILLAAAAANMKFQLVPVVIAASTAIVVAALRKDAGRGWRAVGIGCAIPLIFATPLKNVFLHGNPVYPVDFHWFGRSLPHVEGAYSSTPDWLAEVPRPLRWGASVLELGLRPLSSHARWSIDQWTPPHEPGYRMGGFFGAYVVANVVALLIAVWAKRSRESHAALVFFLGATAIASVMPQSHELRYYMFWMLLLVSLNLILWANQKRVVVGLGAFTALMAVAWSTEGAYLYASGNSFSALSASKVERAALERLRSGERVCISRAPWTFLYAPHFHRGIEFSVQEAETPDECDGARPIESVRPQN